MHRKNENEGLKSGKKIVFYEIKKKIKKKLNEIKSEIKKRECQKW